MSNIPGLLKSDRPNSMIFNGASSSLATKRKFCQLIKLGAWLGVTDGTNREDKVNFCVLFTLSELQDESKSYKQLIL